MVSRDNALPGRPTPLPGIADSNVVLGSPMRGPWPDGTKVLYVAMGCFWGTERIMWRIPGVVTTAAGYMGGFTPNPTYDETCTGRTGHTETVLVAYDPQATSAELILKQFWENHDPTTANRQGNDIGTQYRSAIYWTDDEQAQAVASTSAAFQQVLHDNGFGDISTEMRPASEVGEFYYAEDYHQQYLHKNPGGYCNHGPNGMTCPVGILRQDQLPSQQEIAPPA
ncbi:peptide-methionine (S)-S-oxide reductase MsrA [Rudaeicoccus suwonensis]|nr:peptide-methionine (S)-S-oxide reductase MsrA [Rudaeicoccus suwonensis]